MRILSIFGTRPEAIKMAPVINALRLQLGEDSVKICVTAQHRKMLDEVLQLFAIKPNYDLNIMQPNQNSTQVLCKTLSALPPVFNESKPSMVLVQGDTTTTFSAALAAYFSKIPVAHIEAGLRTHNIYSPWPEEINRSLTARIAALHFAPSSLAAKNLRAEGIPTENIVITGNTVIDSINEIIKLLQQPRILANIKSKFPFINPAKKMILVTAHRRENFGAGINHICKALVKIAELHDAQIIFPVHLNPQIQIPVRSFLQNQPNIFLIEPVNYLHFVYLMQQSYLILTDSGGIQEEAPALGKPVLLMRDTTERPEAIHSGAIKLIGTSEDKIVTEVQQLFQDKSAYHRMSCTQHLYGDGKASQRIVNKITEFTAINAAIAAL